MEWFAREPNSSNVSTLDQESNITAASENGRAPAWLNDLPYDRFLLQTIQKYLITCIVLTIMLSMGCHIDLPNILKHLKKPIGIGVGLFCQFLWMPLIGYGLQFAFSLNEYHSMGLMIIATTPGGSISNLFSYWSKGDVALSVSMTAFNTLVAFGMMPLNLYIYQRSSVDAVPYASIASALAICVIPVAIGMVIKRKWSNISAKITQIGSKLGMFGILIAVILQSMSTPHMFLTTWRPYISSALLPTCGLLSGFITTTIVCLPYRERRTVAIETGCQNVAMAIAITIFVFTGYRLTHVMLVPFLYGVFSVLELMLFAALVQVCTALGLCLDVEESTNEKQTEEVYRYDE